MKRLAGIIAVGSILLSVVAGGVWAAGEPVVWEHSTPKVDRMPWLVGNTLIYVKDYDIYQSTWNGTAWSAPVPVAGKINTAENEINPAVIKGGTVMYFGRTNKAAGTDYDFYRSEWDATTQQWGEPVLVPALSTPTQDWDIWVSEDETVAYVTTKGGFGGVASLGGRDIWRSEMQGGVWSTPVNIGAPINSAQDEWSVYVDTTGKIYFDSDRAGTMGGLDIWVADGLAGPVNNLAVVNSSSAERCMAMSDSFLFFAAQNRSGGRGDYDLWVLPLQ